MRHLISAAAFVLVAAPATAATVTVSATAGWGPRLDGFIVGENAPGPRDRFALDRHRSVFSRKIDSFDPALGTLTRVDLQYVVLRDESWVRPYLPDDGCNETPGGCDQDLLVDATFRYGVDLPPLDPDEDPNIDIGFQIDRQGRAEGPGFGERIYADVPEIPIIDLGPVPPGPPIVTQSESVFLDRFIGPDPLEIAFVFALDVRQALACNVRVQGTRLQDCEAGTDFWRRGSAQLSIDYVYDPAPPPAPVPLPAGLPMLMAGLLALWPLARRKRHAPGTHGS